MQFLYRIQAFPIPRAGLAALVALAMGCGANPPALTAEDAHPDSVEDVDASAPAYGSVQHADESTFDQLVLQAEGPVLVDFHADWCPPCRILSPMIEELARQMPDVLVVKVDVDQNPNLAQRFQVDAIPSLKVFRQGQIVNQHDGLLSEDALRALVGG